MRPDNTRSPTTKIIKFNKNVTAVAKVDPINVFKIKYKYVDPTVFIKSEIYAPTSFTIASGSIKPDDDTILTFCVEFNNSNVSLLSPNIDVVSLVYGSNELVAVLYFSPGTKLSNIGIAKIIELNKYSAIKNNTISSITTLAILYYSSQTNHPLSLLNTPVIAMNILKPSGASQIDIGKKPIPTPNTTNAGNTTTPYLFEV